ncbi:MAG TPA: hypothetical protein VJP88_07700 [Caulobacteraceae bacterium]|nr:hypothetical protein [Caulobacteraceae bacterium]
MADGDSGGSNGVAMVAIVVLVLLGILVGGYVLLGRGNMPAAHSITGSVSTPAGPISGKGQMQ